MYDLRERAAHAPAPKDGRNATPAMPVPASPEQQSLTSPEARADVLGPVLARAVTQRTLARGRLAAPGESAPGLLAPVFAPEPAPVVPDAPRLPNPDERPGDAVAALIDQFQHGMDKGDAWHLVAKLQGRRLDDDALSRLIVLMARESSWAVGKAITSLLAERRLPERHALEIVDVLKLGDTPDRFGVISRPLRGRELTDLTITGLIDLLDRNADRLLGGMIASDLLADQRLSETQFEQLVDTFMESKTDRAVGTIGALLGKLDLPGSVIERLTDLRPRYGSDIHGTQIAEILAQHARPQD